MTSVTLITVGKLKEAFYRDAVSEYGKRLSRYCKLVIKEVPDEKTVEDASPALIHQIKEREGERILKLLDDSMYVCALAIDGLELDSIGLARKLDGWEGSGQSNLCFIIGGSLGLSDDVLSRADFKLSFSKLTFPHQLMRVIFLEQLYRSYRINRNEPYHK